MSKKLDQISDANILKTDFKTQNQFSKALGNVGSSQNKNLLNYVKKLFKQYINDRYKGKESDVYLINKELIKRFRDDFSNFITEYQKTVDTNIDLDEILKDIAIKKQVDDKIIAEIKTIITSVLKQKLKEHINKQNKDINVLDFKKIIKKYQNDIIEFAEIEDVINKIITEQNPFIKNLKIEIKTQVTKITKQLTHNKKIGNYKIHENNLLNKITFFSKNKNITKNKELKRLYWIFSQRLSEKFFKTEIIKDKKINLKINKQNFLIRGFHKVSKVFKHLTKLFKNISKFISGVINVIKNNFITKIIRFVFKYTIKFINFLILKPLSFIFSKISSQIKQITKKILNISKKILKNTLKITLLTPQGLYALGFLLGFLWKKLLDIFPFHKSNYTKHDFFIDFYQLLINLLVKIRIKTERIRNKFPILNSAIDGIISILQNFQEKGIIETIKTSEWYQNTKSFLRSFSIIISACELFATVISWFAANPTFTSIFFTTKAASNFFGYIKRIKKQVPGAKDFFAVVLASIGAEVTHGVTTSVMSMFKKADKDALYFAGAEHRNNNNLKNINNIYKIIESINKLYSDTDNISKVANMVSEDMLILSDINNDLLLYAFLFTNIHKDSKVNYLLRDPKTLYPMITTLNQCIEKYSRTTSTIPFPSEITEKTIEDLQGKLLLILLDITKGLETIQYFPKQSFYTKRTDLFGKDNKQETNFNPQEYVKQFNPYDMFTIGWESKTPVVSNKPNIPKISMGVLGTIEDVRNVGNVKRDDYERSGSLDSVFSNLSRVLVKLEYADEEEVAPILTKKILDVMYIDIMEKFKNSSHTEFETFLQEWMEDKDNNLYTQFVKKYNDVYAKTNKTMIEYTIKIIDDTITKINNLKNEQKEKYNDSLKELKQIKEKLFNKIQSLK